MTARLPALPLAAIAGLTLALWAAPAGREEARLAEVAEERAAIEDELSAAGVRVAVKRAVAEELAAGRATLAEATGHFLAVNRTADGHLASIRRKYPGRTEEECQARNVIDYALAGLDDPAERDRVRERLGAELRRTYPGAEPD